MRVIAGRARPDSWYNPAISVRVNDAMMRQRKPTLKSTPPPARMLKCPTGIQGLDQITGGGIPRGRPTIVCGGPGCGKTLLAAEFLVRGATRFDEPGVFMSFEETEAELRGNVALLGFDLPGLTRRKRILIDHVHIERSEIQETGEYDLEGLFVRLNHAIDSIRARRVVLDTLEALFAGLPNDAILRAELRRLFRWLKDKGVTAIVTGEAGRDHLTRHGLEEYVSDCVIVLDHRVHQQIATRHLRVVKYRGSEHGTNEYPFLIGEEGISVLPITSLGLNHAASSERISTGIPRLDAMLGGKGFFRGSSILLTGTPGTGKTSAAAFFAHAATRRGERALYFAFEESPRQIIRNMRSIGLRLEPWLKRDLLRFHSSRPTLYGLEMHLATMYREIQSFRPEVVILDPMTSLLAAGSESETKSMVTRLIDFLKSRGITSLFTSLTQAGNPLQQSEIAISSLMDSWLVLEDIEGNGERNRALYVVKSRGMEHSNQRREILISRRGISLLDPYIGPEGVLTGAARAAQAAKDRAAALTTREEAARSERELKRKLLALEQRIAVQQSEYEAERENLQRLHEQLAVRARVASADRRELAFLRHAGAGNAVGTNRNQTPRKQE